MPASRLQRSYSLGEKRELLIKFDALGWSSRKFCAEFLVPRATWARWRKLRAKLTTTQRNLKRRSLSGQGKTIIPFKNELLAFMKDVRREEHILTSMHMVTYMKTHHKQWLDQYKATKKDPYKAILGLCQAFARRHRFSQRVPCHSKMREPDLVLVGDEFAAKFWGKYSDYRPHDIINVDETAVYYDMPPCKIWAEIGGSSKTDKTQKHSDRITAVLSCRADGMWLHFLV
ncbi:hypothetical protein DYB28_006570 [Aphanomyces astaci]|uniref:DDE-1 domain-containing protein n=1 Tax=Aphanomyces astaci TaxID=112090 RepID=A0A9X8DJQ1_APHAT|nr:hypothetical protein DYB28_006570 [Aphanomyces astaci]